MQERTLGEGRLAVSAVGLGCMGMSQSYPPFPEKSEMIDLIRAAVMFTLTVVAAREGSPLDAIVLAGIATTFSVAYGPCVNAAIPRIVGEDDLSAVNTLSATVTNCTPASTSRRASRHCWPNIVFPYRSRTLSGSAASQCSSCCSTAASSGARRSTSNAWAAGDGAACP